MSEADLNTFFQDDLYIKKLMYDLKPSDIDLTGDDARINYGDKLYKSLKDIEFRILRNCHKINLTPIACNHVENIFKVYYQVLSNLDNYDDYKNFYESITNMNSALVNETKANIFGYSINHNASPIIMDCNSINELLHVIHSDIVNNEKNYQEIDTNNIKNKELYLNVKEELDNFDGSDLKQIVPLNKGNKILLMVRDLGHALTVEITKNENEFNVDYFIPKLCDIEKINNLKGINKVADNAPIFSGATGSFTCASLLDLKTELNKFLNQVPTDDDLFSKNSR